MESVVIRSQHGKINPKEAGRRFILVLKFIVFCMRDPIFFLGFVNNQTTPLLAYHISIPDVPVSNLKDEKLGEGTIRLLL